jgi:2,5-diketo-D-gluconate reductase A|tara:strand:- start:275 stop:1219 length:945 start_codon:yes stop_codon:yes gene_type:complete
MLNAHRIGKHGNLPTIGYGTYQMTNEEVENFFFEALRMGYRHVDTAESYGNEIGVGRAIQRAMSELGLKREEIFVTTKLWPGNMQWGQPEKDFESTMTSFETSLSNLGLEYIDLYLLHTAFPTEARLEQWRALAELRNRGVVKFIGVSNFSQQHIEEISSAKLPLPEANQIELHPWSQKTSLLEFMNSNSIVPIAYSSLLPLPSWRANAPPDVMGNPSNAGKNPGMFDSDDTDVQFFGQLAEKYNVTTAQILLKWAIQRGFAILPRSTNSVRMEENFKLDHFDLNENEMARMNDMDRGRGMAWGPVVMDPIDAN